VNDVDDAQAGTAAEAQLHRSARVYRLAAATTSTYSRGRARPIIAVTLAGDGVLDVQLRTDQPAHQWVLPPVLDNVEADYLLLAPDLQAQETPACRSAGSSTST
jgi:hypothetical protein